MGIGTKLRKILDEKNMTVAELSRLTGISTNTLYAAIRRDGDKMNGDALIKLSEALQVPLSTLFSEGETMLILDDEGTFHGIDYNAIGLKPETEKDITYEINFKSLKKAYDLLNVSGQREAIKRISELAEIKKYTE